MADIDLSTITQPISDDQPCGPDLDDEFDADFMGLDAEIQGVFPARYFSFDAADVDFSGYYDRLGDIMERTHDVRLLVSLAKLRILQGKLDSFVEAVVAVNNLLQEHWADAHPNAADFIDARVSQVATLDEMPSSVLPFQHVVLFRSRRAGPITLRKWQIAQGEVKPREGEDAVDASTILSEIRDAKAEDMDAILATVTDGREALTGIRAIFKSEAGVENIPGLEKLPAAFDGIIDMINQGMGRGSAEDNEAGGDGANADGSTAGGVYVQVPTGDVASRENAIEAMFQAEKYYALNEPSSPIALLLREAQSVASKGFAELVGDLVPSASSYAFVQLGREPWFEVSLGDLNSRNPVPEYDTEDATADESHEDAGLDDDATEGEENADEADGAEGDGPEDGPGKAADEENSAEDGAGGENSEDESFGDDSSEEEITSDEASVGDALDEDGSDDEELKESEEEDSEDDAVTENVSASEPELDDSGKATQAPVRKLVANSRQEALALIDKVLTYYRIAEPSSPVPLILERAIEMSTKNFIGLLQEVLPEGHLKARSTTD